MPVASNVECVEKLRDYLRTLKPEARAMLVAELERGVLRGDEAANDFVLQELRRAIRAAGQPVKRIGDAARLFFAPIEPFLVDDGADHGRIGRIARISLEPMWEWIRRDLMPAEAKALADDINRALLDDDQVKAELLTRALQERAVQRIRETVAKIGGDEKARRRLAVQVGTQRALDDLHTLTRILEVRDMLADLARRLPSQIRTFDRDPIDQVKAMLDAAAQHKPDIDPARKADILLFGLVLVMGRLTAPWQLVGIATRAAESDDAARVAETPYAVAVAIVLGEIECQVGELRAEIKAHRPVNSLLRNIHDAARTLRTEMDLSVESPWGRQLAAVRTEVSNLLKAEIESTPGRVRRLLRPRPLDDVGYGALDAIDVGDAETLIELVGACRTYASELAVNEVTMRTWSELQQYLETSTKVLLDALRHAGEDDRPFRQSQVDAAIRFCKAVLGADYAAVLAKAAEIAAQGGALERRSARA